MVSAPYLPNALGTGFDLPGSLPNKDEGLNSALANANCEARNDVVEQQGGAYPLEASTLKLSDRLKSLACWKFILRGNLRKPQPDVIGESIDPTSPPIAPPYDGSMNPGSSIDTGEGGESWPRTSSAMPPERFKIDQISRSGFGRDSPRVSGAPAGVRWDVDYWVGRRFLASVLNCAVQHQAI
jgi:hypothetical protein